MRRTIAIVIFTLLATTAAAYGSGYQATFLTDVMVPRQCEIALLSVDIDCPCPCASNGSLFLELLDEELEPLAVAKLPSGWCCITGERLVALDRTVSTCEIAYIRVAVPDTDCSRFWLGLKVPKVNCGRVCWQSIYKGDLDMWTEYNLPGAYLAVPRYIRPQHSADMPVTTELVPPPVPEVGVVIKPEPPAEEQLEDTGAPETNNEEPDTPPKPEDASEVPETVVVEGLG
jgi:hypothetical protein